MRTLRLILLGAVLALPVAVQAQDVGERVPASSMDKNNDGKIDAWETVEVSKEEASADDVVKYGTEVADAAKDLHGADTKSVTLWAVLLGALFKLMLSLVKVMGKNFSWFESKESKRIIKYSTLGLGAIAAVCANVAFALPWPEAIEFLLSGPLAVAIHEYSKDSKGSSAGANV